MPIPPSHGKKSLTTEICSTLANNFHIGLYMCIQSILKFHLFFILHSIIFKGNTFSLLEKKTHINLCHPLFLNLFLICILKCIILNIQAITFCLEWKWDTVEEYVVNLTLWGLDKLCFLYIYISDWQNQPGRFLIKTWCFISWKPPRTFLK